MTKVSVIIPCFNAAPWIEQTLKSAVEQWGAEMEIIVIDDGSTDDSAQIVAQRFPQVRLVKAAHQGVSSSRRLGTEMASGEYIQYLDADDILAKGKIANQLKCFEKNGCDVVYGDWQKLLRNEDNEFRPGPIVTDKIQADVDVAILEGFWHPPAAYLFKSTIAKQTAWREEYPVIQDARFVLDCALKGAIFYYCPGLSAYYRAHSSKSVSTSDYQAFLKDVLNNAQDVEMVWRKDDFTEERKQALIHVYGYLMRASFGGYPDIFENSYSLALQLMPDYCPSSPKGLALMTKCFGYRNAERLAFCYRKFKKVFKK
jgi:glycosyltransferase involved in cell wall biosynthesis